MPQQLLSEHHQKQGEGGIFLLPSIQFSLSIPHFAGPNWKLPCKRVLEIELCSVQSSTSSLTPIHEQDCWKWSYSTREIRPVEQEFYSYTLAHFLPLTISMLDSIKAYLQLSHSSLPGARQDRRKE